MTVLLVLLVFGSSASIDFADVRYVRAVERLDIHRAARWSAFQWCAGTVGFVIAVKLSLWLLPAECAGLYFGTWLSLTLLGRRPPTAEG